MINTEITTTKGMEQAQRQMEQAKNELLLRSKLASNLWTSDVVDIVKNYLQNK